MEGETSQEPRNKKEQFEIMLKLVESQVGNFLGRSQAAFSYNEIVNEQGNNPDMSFYDPMINELKNHPDVVFFINLLALKESLEANLDQLNSVEE